MLAASRLPKSTAMQTERKKIIVLGGGYAGLSTAVLLSRSGKFQVTLVDSRERFLNQIHLHKTVSEPIDHFQIPYTELADRFDFQFLPGKIDTASLDLAKLETTGRIRVMSEELPFDYLAICTGARARSHDSGHHIYTLDYLKEHGGEGIVSEAMVTREHTTITVIGGGATGIQFLFELHDFLRKKSGRFKFQIVQMDDRLVPGMPRAFHNYTMKRLKDRGIECYLSTRFIEAANNQLKLEGPDGSSEISSDLTLMLSGVEPVPELLRCNVYGQLLLNGRPSNRIFAAGDCSVYEGSGLNSFTAQTAVRKGRTIASNIEALDANKPMSRYKYQELGYFLSLGPWDGIGWIVFPFNTIAGPPAFAIKEAIEMQFQFFLKGLDTYIDWLS
ncbi:MAG: FAD-dependent oxidoreductase [Leptospiraceae bacterium]|nr:FAD-dependent oxidoreductase [Leptospiraceae bacterium]